MADEAPIPADERIAEKLAEAEEIKGRSLWQDARSRFFRNKAAVGGADRAGAGRRLHR